MDETGFLSQLARLLGVEKARPTPRDVHEPGAGGGDAAPGGPDKCTCPDCDYETDKKRGVPCRSMVCPECGAELVAQVKKVSREELREARAKRAKKYGIAAKEGGHLTPPKGYPASADDYGDPVNYVYPLDPGRRQAARSYFNHEGQRAAGGYSSAEWAIVGKRIAGASGEAYEYKDGKVQRKEAKRVEKSFYVPIAKADAVKQLVYGVVLEPDTVDGQDDRINAEEIERACHGFMLRSQTLDLEHERKLDMIEAAIVENYIAPQELTWKHDGQATTVPPGSWVMVTKVFSDDIWKQVEDGALTGYSVRGWGVRNEVR